MILTIDIPDELLARATAAGLAPVQMSRFAIAGIVTAVDAVSGKPSRNFQGRNEGHLDRPPTGAELIEKMDAEGLLSGYGDPANDSPDLAGKLRERLSRRVSPI